MGLDRFMGMGESSLSLMKGLGLPPVAGEGGLGVGRRAGTAAMGGPGGAGIQLAGAGAGKKRLGMGRPMVPWGEKGVGAAERDGGLRKKPRAE